MTTTQEIDQILKSYRGRTDDLIPVLQEIQARFHYLPEEGLRALARRLRLPLTEIFHVATFYNCFSLKPRGQHHVRVCLGTACHVRGGQKILDKVLRELQLPASGTTSDFEFTVEPVRCLGCCGLAPVVRVDQSTFGHLVQTRIPRMLKRFSKPPVGAKG